MTPAERETAAPLQRRLGETVRVLATYLALTIALTWPLVSRFADALPDGSDGWQYLWKLWWMKTALVDLHSNPFHTDLLYYPYGVSLYFDTPIPLLGVLSIPFQLAGLPLPAVYNLLVVLGFVLGGYGTYLLVRHLTGCRPAAFVAGTVFAFCPYHFAHLRGHLNLVSLQWIPLYVLALLHAWAPARAGREEPVAPAKQAQFAAGCRRQWAWAATAGLWLAANAYTEWMYALFLGLFTAWFAAWRLLREPGPSRRGGLARLALTGGVALILVGPVLVPMVQEARGATYMQATLPDVSYLSSDLTDAFLPNLFHPLWPDHGAAVLLHYQGRPAAEIVVFAGYTVLLLSLGAVWAFRRRPAVVFWGWTALGAWVLSLGPILHVWGQSQLGGLRIPLPYALLYYLPFFNIFRVPARLMVIAMLALAVLLGYALAAAFAGQWRRRAGRAVRGPVAATVAGLLVLGEFVAVPYPLMPSSADSAFYQQVAHEPGRFAILDLPLIPVAAYLDYQTIHQRPIVGGNLSRQPPDRFVEQTPVLRYLLPATPVDDPLAGEAVRTGLADLRRSSVRYVVVHWWVAYGPEKDALQAKLDRVFGGVAPRRLAGSQTEIFALAPED